MISPLKNYKYDLPNYNDVGGFSFVRKFDIHTGIDLYCEEYDNVYAIEDGEIVSIEKFTGSDVGSPWWNNTDAVMIEGASGVILYGEIEVDSDIRFNKKFIKEGDLIGVVKRVLKKDKGIVPPNMLHLELYETGTRSSVIWNLGENKPENLLDIYILLKNFL